MNLEVTVPEVISFIKEIRQQPALIEKFADIIKC